MKPEVGQVAPDFEAPVIGGEYGEEESSVKLSELKGERVVLVFYPKDNTPGCTTQGCSMRDDWNKLKGKARIFGVSIDPIKSHVKFIDKQSLPYALISDEEKAIVEAYGVWVEKQMYGKKYMGTERSTFVIGIDGKIEAVLEKVKPAAHLDDLLAVLDA
ncbi:peroxiredoxin Q/BCP [Rubritalea squalenifaciens DSM 18772]|uniref:thioredoxin-dependent peroxiredoxin n=1 Tax=Rubritalea squalenifaciens DSM 18772 TaxID=1123071 RepID=A0A1M6JB82_9BACT|nr:peroxiredoxin [Rubritalea squalenifaciens]SHJ43969.1 peroxiredoxin Q/BCP [Rubritalea squalenifaciens DSM 18772]